MFEAFRTARGVIRSLHIYYGDRSRALAMDRLHSRFVRRGDLVFDVGAHVGDRVASFRRLGVRVVAVEPQPALVKVLRVLYGLRRGVVIEPVAVGRRSGTTRIIINQDNPTISTVSEAFVSAAVTAPGWETQRWTKSLIVPVTTLDALIERHGVPSFVKVDVEGFEEEVLQGLSHSIKALSFEFTIIQRVIALACIDRCVTLGFSRFNAVLGESQDLVHADWIDSVAIARWLIELSHETNSGDIYAAVA